MATPTLVRKSAPILIALGVVGVYVVVAGKTGFCPSCQMVLNTVTGGGEGRVIPVAQAGFEPAQIERDPRTPEGFKTIRRGVDIATEYDLSGLSIPSDQIHTLLPRDAIPSLTNPETQPVDEAMWLQDGDRILVITVGDETVGAPIKVLNFHEIANMTIGGSPVAATYCPLCDSATAISRDVTNAGGETETLEFGVSGALYNSNVLMYDRQHRGLWSQLGMEAVSGPMVGTRLSHLPTRMMTFARFKKAHPGARVLTSNTGHRRQYEISPYEEYFASPEFIMVPIAGHGEALPKKTLGLGVRHGDQAWFVPVSAIGERREVETPAGVVVITTSDAGVHVVEAPRAVETAQTFYYSWSAFYPDTSVVE